MNTKYEILSVIGEGSYGIVYKCKEKDKNEVVAIKKFKTSSEYAINKSMLRELKSLKLLSHKNIINLRESFKKKGSYYFVFDFVDKNLLEFISCNYPKGVDISLMKKIIFQICCGLRQMHKFKVAHRDIKPENILIDNSKQIKLCDFGFAKMLSNSENNMTNQDKLTEYVATRWYRAPELLIGVKTYGMEIDYWSLGCILGELIDGNPVFPGESDIEQLYMINKICGKDAFESLVTLKNFFQNKKSNENQLIQKNNGDKQVLQYLNNSIKIDFTGKLAKDVIEKIEKTKYLNPSNGTEIMVNISLEARYGGKVSKDVLSLMKRLLDPNPLTRIKSEDIFKHEFFSDIDLNKEEVVDMNMNKNENHFFVSKPKYDKSPLNINRSNQEDGN